MNRRWVSALFAFSLLILGRPSRAQQCSDCDCNHFPIEKKCEKCCGFASGQITSVTTSSVVITENKSTSHSGAVKKTFALTPATKKNAVLKEGAQATVYYHAEGNVATKVDVVEELKGLLVPSDEPDPPLPTACSNWHPVDPDALRIYMGGNAGLTTSDKVTVLSVKGTDLIYLRRTSKGLAINAKTFSEDGKVIAEIVDNRFYVNPNNFFRMEKPDTHSVVVYDFQDRKVMDLRYINSHSIRVEGIFQVPGAPPFRVARDGLWFGGLHVTGSCFSGAGTIFKY